MATTYPGTTIEVSKFEKGGSKQLFDRQKLLSGLLKACEKRPVNADELVSEIEAEIQNSLNNEVESAQIGEMVMERLKALDDIAYVRFASVYRQFKDVNSFMEELAKIIK